MAKWVWLLCCVIGPQPIRAQPDPAREKILYTVANSHLDTQWNWTIRSTIYPYLSNTLSHNFAYFEKYPDYTFNFEGAFRYRLAKEYYPEHYETLKRYIAAGRWRVAGGVVDAGDVVIPSPESLFRQALYGNGFFQREFGKTSVDVFLPDCFGFPYSLPSIAAHSGMKGFSTAKLLWGSAIPFPFQNIGRWIGPDGNSVMAIIQPEAYDSGITDNLAQSSRYLDRIGTMSKSTGLNLDFRYFGTGDVGGAPKESYVEWLEKSIRATNDPIRVLSAGSDQIFRDLTATQIEKLPTYQGELLMQIHGVGCYTAHSEMKTYNRRNELRADAAERASVIADWLQGGGTYPQEQLTRAWERFLWHQFHDDLTGTSIDAAYNFSWNDELLSLQDFATAQTRGVGGLARALDTKVTGVPLVIFNSLSIEREDVVETTVKFSGPPPQAVRVFDSTGHEVPSQTGKFDGVGLPVIFAAKVPANGAAVFDVRPADQGTELNTGLAVTASQLENRRYRIKLNEAGDVASIYDKIHRRELLRGSIRWAFLPNVSTSWPAWEITYASVREKPSYLGAPARIEILESGPARVALAITRFKDGSTITERLRLNAGEASDRVEWDVSANWHTRKTLLKVEFPLTASNPQGTFDLGLGTIQRSNATPALYEVPAQQWVDLTDATGDYGVTIMNDAKYGWDKPDDHTLRMTIFHTPETGSSYAHGGHNSIGTHHFKFAVMGHVRDWRAGESPWAAARINQPLQAFQTSSHQGALGRSFSFLAQTNSNVMVKAMKKAERSDEVVVRLQELTGQPQTTLISCASDIVAARELLASEELIQPLKPENGRLAVSLTGYQPRTIALTLARPATLVARPHSVPIQLPFDLDAISTDANRADGEFAAGLTYPAELVPPVITSDGITFLTGPTNDGRFNAVICRGQTIPLNASNFTHLDFLAAATSENALGTFRVDGRDTPVKVQHFTGFIGQWNPPWLKPDRVGWVFTHRHTRTANDPYRFCYWFKYRLDLPANARAITLPDSPDIRVFAMSLVRNDSGETAPAGGPLAANEIPWANAGEDVRVNCDSDGQADVTLDATGSADPDGRILDYVWSENGANIATGVRPTIRLGVGSHSVLLAVTDDRGSVNQDQVEVIVKQPLQAALNATPTSGVAAPLTVRFEAQASGRDEKLICNTVDDRTGIISAQGENPPSETAAKLFDHRSTTKWLERLKSNPGGPLSWVQYQYASRQQVKLASYALTSANDAPARDPMNWRLLGSNDDGTNWFTLDVRTNVVFPNRLQRLEFKLAGQSGFNLYRLQIDRVANPPATTLVQLAEWELIGTPPYVYAWNFGDGGFSSAPNPEHTFGHEGVYPVELASFWSDRNATNLQAITVGPPLTVQVKAASQRGNEVQFSSHVSGGNGGRKPFDTTCDGYGSVRAQGENFPKEGMLQAFDQNPATKWLDCTLDPITRSTWLEYHYANGWPYVLTGYALTSADDAPARDPLDWELLGSNDNGTNWVVLDVRKGEIFKDRFERRAFDLVNDAGFKCYRIQINSVADPGVARCAQLAELELIGRPVVRYAWLFGDGGTSTEANPQHKYRGAGNYIATVVVSDGLTTATNSARVVISR